MTHDADTRPSGIDTGPDPDEPSAELDHVTIENETAPDECAIFPSRATEDELAGNWISASEGSFVDLESIR